VTAPLPGPFVNSHAQFTRLRHAFDAGTIAADQFHAALDEVAFEYQGNVIVVSVREVGDEVEISGYDRNTHQPLSWRCERVFLAAGAIPTTRILLKSLGAYDQTVHLKDSQYFLLPMTLIVVTPHTPQYFEREKCPRPLPFFVV